MRGRRAAVRALAMFALLAGSSVQPAFSQAPTEVGIITHVAGGVRIRTGTGDEGTPKPFSRVYLNDRFTLSAGGVVRVLFLRTGSSLLWQGPAEFSMGDTASAGGTEPAQVRLLPVSAREKIQVAMRPDVFGGTTVRAIKPGPRPPADLGAAQLAEIRDIYQQLRKTFPEDDITPELFLAASMQPYQVRQP